MSTFAEKQAEIITEITQYEITDTDQLEQFRIRFLGTKNIIKDLFQLIKTVPAEQRKEVGQQLNALKQQAQQRFDEAKEAAEKGSEGHSAAPTDMTLPPVQQALGSLHPLWLVREQIVQIFERMGYNVTEGPEIEDDWHNFSALHFPANHPARDMQDTFFVEAKDGQEPYLLRTHTSSVQVRLMENQQPPIRSIMPGRVFRNEAISARAHCIFHQVEGLYINTDVSFTELKQTLFHFAKEMFGANTDIRFRPSYFPFTEPSAEVDISCFICNGDGCNICKHTGWVEIAGCGMVDPAVLDNCGIDSEKYTGFAFGMGIERITMLKYKVSDLRLFTENDVRFLQSFAKL